eukprot:TRINITY_DN14871_c0_g1_i1.p1 TRINITY_DN14871_c0_g1~~TRINITY_DN14871_c0_g1_i1.p1  ORF type:complete len:249 (-),score=49.08 TRINITY_DN14871_c0_g1_i1:131-838(-)
MSFWSYLGATNENPTPELPSPKTPEEYNHLIEEKGELMYSIIEDPRWTKIDFLEDDGSVSDVELSDLVFENNPLTFVRTRITYKISAERIFKLVQSKELEEIKLFDKDMTSMRILEDVSENLVVLFTTYEAPFPVATREFLVLRGGKKDAKGNYVSINTSIQYQDVPEEAGNVRGVLNVGGWIITPLDADSCRCTRVAQVDPKGWIPPFVVNLFKQKAAEGMVDIKRLIGNGKLL